MTAVKSNSVVPDLDELEEMDDAAQPNPIAYNSEIPSIGGPRGSRSRYASRPSNGNISGYNPSM